MAHEFKFSKGKIRYDLVDPETVYGLACVVTHGQDKGHPEYSHKEVPVQEWIGAYQRHMREHMKYLATGKIEHAFDKESGLLHVDHAMCNLSYIRWCATQDTKIQKRLDQVETNRENNNI